MTEQEMVKWLEERPPIQFSEVYDKVDPRHVGTLTAIFPSHGSKKGGMTGRVVWENGWESDLPMARLRYAN